MERRITALGPGDRKSYTVTLPIDWVRENSLDKSRKADISIVGEAIVVRPFDSKTAAKIIDASQLTNSLSRVLQILYKAGANEIRIVNCAPRTVGQLFALLEQKCIGFEIVYHQKNTCIIKEVSKESAESFHTLLRRCFLVLLQMGDEKNEEAFQNLDHSLNRLSAYCMRLLVREGYGEFGKMQAYSRFVSALEHAGDEIKRSRKFSKNTPSWCNRLLRKEYELYYSFTPQGFESLQTLIGQYRIRHPMPSLLHIINTLLGIIYLIKNT